MRFKAKAVFICRIIQKLLKKKIKFYHKKANERIRLVACVCFATKNVKLAARFDEKLIENINIWRLDIKKKVRNDQTDRRSQKLTFFSPRKKNERKQFRTLFCWGCGKCFGKRCHYLCFLDVQFFIFSSKKKRKLWVLRTEIFVSRKRKKQNQFDVFLSYPPVSVNRNESGRLPVEKASSSARHFSRELTD